MKQFTSSEESDATSFYNHAGPYIEGEIFYRRYRDKYCVQWSSP